MRSRRSLKSGLFLIELIIMILFFAIASAICVRLFVHAHLTAKASTDLSQAVFISQSAAETIKGTDASSEKLSELLGAVPSENGYSVFYDKNWQRMASSQDCSYRMDITLKKTENILTAALVVIDTEKNTDAPIYDLTVNKLLLQ